MPQALIKLNLIVVPQAQLMATTILNFINSAALQHIKIKILIIVVFIQLAALQRSV